MLIVLAEECFNTVETSFVPFDGGISAAWEGGAEELPDTLPMCQRIRAVLEGTTYMDTTVVTWDWFATHIERIPV